MLWNLEGLKGHGMKGRDNGKSNGVVRYTKDTGGVGYADGDRVRDKGMYNDTVKDKLEYCKHNDKDLGKTASFLRRTWKGVTCALRPSPSVLRSDFVLSSGQVFSQPLKAG